MKSIYVYNSVNTFVWPDQHPRSRKRTLLAPPKGQSSFLPITTCSSEDNQYPYFLLHRAGYILKYIQIDLYSMYSLVCLISLNILVKFIPTATSSYTSFIPIAI